MTYAMYTNIDRCPKNVCKIDQTQNVRPIFYGVFSHVCRLNIDLVDGSTLIAAPGRTSSLNKHGGKQYESMFQSDCNNVNRKPLPIPILLRA